MESGYGIAGGTAQEVNQKIDTNLIGSRLASVYDELKETYNLINYAANTLFGSEPSVEAEGKDERPPTVINLVGNLETLARQLRNQASRF